MPYRRLPNTDAARIRAIKKALEMYPDDNIDKAPYSLKLEGTIKKFLPNFEIAVNNSKEARERQIKNSHKFLKDTKKARLYISHFIQVLNFCIIRGEIKPCARTYFGLNEKDSKLPSLLTEQEILEWGEKVLKGDKERLNDRCGNPIYSPSAALVRVNFEDFKKSYYFHKGLQKNVTRFSKKVSQLRTKADEIILELWNSIEHSYFYIQDETKRRELCEKFGITYIYRKGEKEKMQKKEIISKKQLQINYIKEKNSVN